jgi:hypothetical protein
LGRKWHSARSVLTAALSALLPTCLAKVNACFGSTARVRWSSDSGRPSGSNPTLRPGGRLSASLRAFERFGLSACFVPTTDIPPQRDSDRFRQPMPPSFHLNQRSSLLDRLCPNVSNTLAPFSLSLNASTCAHTFIWRQTQWASVADHSKTGKEISDE